MIITQTNIIVAVTIIRQLAEARAGGDGLRNKQKRESYELQLY